MTIHPLHTARIAIVDMGLSAAANRDAKRQIDAQCEYEIEALLAAHGDPQSLLFKLLAAHLNTAGADAVLALKRGQDAMDHDSDETERWLAAEEIREAMREFAGEVAP